MRRVDYHVHSSYSFDAKDTMEALCRQASEIGLAEICFTEHFSVDHMDVSYGFLQYQAYSESVKQCQELFQDQLIIRQGLEIGEPHLRKYQVDLAEQTKKMNLDFIIGSVHNINSVKLRLYISGGAKEKIYEDYFNEIYQLIQFADFDVIGHFDLIKRYAYTDFGNYEFAQYRDLLQVILEEIIKKGIGLEVNTSGMKNSVREPFPAWNVLALYRKLGGTILTFGSDAHNCADLGSHYDETMAMLKALGFKYIFTYKQREPMAIQLE
jgi:histidinol-phosphatase (PHP family)